MKNLAERLQAIESLENELLRKAQPIVPPGAPFTIIDNFLLGAIKRTLSQSVGFRKLVEGWNFSCATILVRTQIDTAMRINGIPLLASPETDVRRLFNGETTFKRLKSIDGKLMSDQYLRERLSEKYPWVTQLYEETSDFVHLSFRHFWPTLIGTSDDGQMFYSFLSGEDPKHDESNYHDVADAFLKVSKMTSELLLALLMVRHRGDEVRARLGPGAKE
jgi:hypothetical protein